MEQPPGFIDLDKPNHVCRLRKKICGLKQAPCALYLGLKTFSYIFVSRTLSQILQCLCYKLVKKLSIYRFMLMIS